MNPITMNSITLMIETKGDEFIYYNNKEHISNELVKNDWNNVKSGIYPSIFHWYSRRGLYVFRIYKNFQHRYVIIDDTNISIKKTKENYARFISLLIYKAWLKLNIKKTDNNFESVMMDLTGNEVMSADILHTKPEEILEQWKYLKSVHNLIPACSIDDINIYPIINSYEETIDGKTKKNLIWYGNDFNKDEEQKEYYKEISISYKLWRNKFKRIYACYDYYKDLLYDYSIWKFTMSTNEPKDQKYVILELSEKTTNVLIMISQESNEILSIGFKIYAINNQNNPLYEFSQIKRRQISEHVQLNGPNNYIIIPMIENKANNNIYFISIKFDIEPNSASKAVFDGDNVVIIKKKRNIIDCYEVMNSGLMQCVLMRKKYIVVENTNLQNTFI